MPLAAQKKLGKAKVLPGFFGLLNAFKMIRDTITTNNGLFRIGEKVNVKDIIAGDFIGEITYILDNPRRVTVKVGKRRVRLEGYQCYNIHKVES